MKKEKRRPGVAGVVVKTKYLPYGRKRVIQTVVHLPRKAGKTATRSSLICSALGISVSALQEE